jgi:hypothetical protein
MRNREPLKPRANSGFHDVPDDHASMITPVRLHHQWIIDRSPLGA